jgi:hypothetical protein
VGVRKTGAEGDLELRRNSNKRLKENFMEKSFMVCHQILFG